MTDEEIRAARGRIGVRRGLLDLDRLDAERERARASEDAKDKEPVPEMPEPQTPAPEATPEPMHQCRFVTAGPKNPRICEACEGPCRPGAGVCDKCRATTRVAATE